MPLNKQAFRRYIIIARELQKPDPSKILDLQRIILWETGIRASVRTLQKDIQDMCYDEELRIYAPIKYARPNKYYLPREWNLFDALKQNWS